MQFTNNSKGLRGIRLQDGSAVWLEPGETADIDENEIVEPLPDLGGDDVAPSSFDEDAVTEPAPADPSLVETLIERAERAEQGLETAEGDVATLRTELDAANDKAADLQSQVEKLEAENADLAAKLAALDNDGNGTPGGSKPQDPPALTGKNKAELLEIAKSEGAEVDEGATNADIVAAIELKREAAASQ